MARRFHIPGIVDFLSVDNASELAEFGDSAGLDRSFVPRGPLINRILVSRIRSLLAIGGHRLPSIAPRSDADRARKQVELRQRLDGMATPCDEGTLWMLSAAIRGAGNEGPPLAVLVQQAVGRMFVPDYVASEATWDAARTLDTAVRTRNPVRSLIWRLTGRVERAKQLLAERVNGDTAGVHATGIAVHNLVRGLERMRDEWADAKTHGRAPPATDVARYLFAPESVLRQPISAEVPIAVRPGTLVMLKLEAARQQTPSPATTFMAGSWAACPASGILPVFLRVVQERALSDTTIG